MSNWSDAVSPSSSKTTFCAGHLQPHSAHRQSKTVACGWALNFAISISAAVKGRASRTAPSTIAALEPAFDGDGPALHLEAAVPADTMLERYGGGADRLEVEGPVWLLRATRTTAISSSVPVVIVILVSHQLGMSCSFAPMGLNGSP